jgi:hypothetical protein
VTLAHFFHKEKSFAPHLSSRTGSFSFFFFGSPPQSGKLPEKKKKKQPLVLIGESLTLRKQSCDFVEKTSTFLGIIYGNILK